MADHPFIYVSTRASIDPVKTIMLLGPAASVQTTADAEAFARATGWVDEAELDAGVLVVPVAPATPAGWDDAPADLPMQLYQTYRRSFKAVGSEGIAGRGGNLWAWETLIYLVGYGDGAAFAGSYLLANPGFAAASAFVDGVPASLAALDEPSPHWLVSHPRDYDAQNRDIPCSLWLMGTACGEASTALREHVIAVDGATTTSTVTCAGHQTIVHANPENAGMQLRETPGLTGTDPAIAHAVMSDFFNRIIRWKNAPDGTLAPRKPKDEFASDGTYRHATVDVDGVTYHYVVYLPGGAAAVADEARGLPLLLSIHGRGEPTWIFSGKNGWEELADETGAFAVMLPDSPGNVWSIERDGAALCAMVDDAVAAYGFDAERIYLTGFSNGACFTCQMATTYPERFAAASPWNGPSAEAIRTSDMGAYVYKPAFAEAGYQMPMWLCYGDADDKAGAPEPADVATMCAANGCGAEPAATWGAEHYTADNGYTAGERFSTQVYTGASGQVMVGVTEMKNMPHGAIADEARAAWTFLKQFKRVDNAAQVEVL